MPLVPKLKALAHNIPPAAGFLLARWPYRWRPGIGRVYRKRQAEMAAYERMSAEQRRAFILERMRGIVEYAYADIPFYREMYDAAGFRPERLRGFDDIRRIPVVTKEQMRQYDLERRSAVLPGRYLENTGGSSGNPLSFYVLPSCVGNEWSHMHAIWAKLGFGPRHLKLSFGGRNMLDVPIAYDGLRHHYAANIYCPWSRVAEALLALPAGRRIRYLHGYPSAIYDFACYCEGEAPELTRRMRRDLRGAMLSSEYPSPPYRAKIESVFGIDTVSWYGHTERAALAGERRQRGVYEPFQTYGYAEAVDDPHTGKCRLMATAYYNTASPFIRYDTADEIRVEREEGGVLAAFAIEGGRQGDYVEDRRGKAISLTGLIFGRHHKAFSVANFILVHQDRPGHMMLLVTPRGELDREVLASLFDLTGVDMHFSYRLVGEPFRTAGGKILLKVAGELPPEPVNQG